MPALFGLMPPMTWAKKAWTRILRRGLLRVIVACVLAHIATSWYLARHEASDSTGWLRYFFSIAMRRLATNTYDPDLLRHAFRATPLVATRRIEGHTHPESARSRNTASTTAEAVARVANLDPFFSQRSKADERHDRRGNRSWYWDKDTPTVPTLDVPPPSSLDIHIDSDYYVDMPTMLADRPRPTLLYTFQPDDAAATREDYSFTFDANSQVDYRVTGGGHYSHPVWNYSTECIRATSWSFGFIPRATTVYMVERRRVSSDHYLVALAPVATWRGVWTLLPQLLLGTPLRRLRTHDSGFTRISLIGRTGPEDEVHRISTARCGGFLCATIPIAADDAISTAVRIGKHDITPPSVESHINAHPQTPEEAVRNKQLALLLTEYHRIRSPGPSAVVYPVEDAVRRYQFGAYTPDARPTMQAYMTPFVHEGYAPDATQGNEQRAVDKRIIEPRTNPSPPKPKDLTPLVHTCISEFAAHCIPIPGMLRPVEVDDIYEQMNRPTQRHMLEDAETQFAALSRRIKSFLKRETYSKPADPRVISTINTPDKRDYSRLTLALAAHFKTMPWYAFGMTPAEICARVVDVCKDADYVEKTDHKKFDGHINYILRLVESALLHRAFPPGLHSMADDLHASQRSLRAAMPSGIKYRQEDERASGSPETSLFNTVDNAFCTYLGYRMTKDLATGDYHTPHDAWAALCRCIFGGDDGVTRNLPHDSLVRAAESIGLSVESEVVRRGEFGVEFLSRQYGPDVWYGDPNSMCDLSRCLSKLHTTPPLASNVSPAQKAKQKCLGYVLTDHDTPIVGPFCAKILSLYNDLSLDSSTATLRSWWSRYPTEHQYVNVAAPWMDHHAFGVLGLDKHLFDAWLATTTTGLDPPLLVAPTPPKRTDAFVVVDDEVVPPEDKSHPVAPRGTINPPSLSQSARADALSSHNPRSKRQARSRARAEQYRQRTRPGQPGPPPAQPP